MKQKLFHTENNWGPFIIRLFLAIVVLPHGAQKLFGAFGGFGFSGTMDFFTGSMGLPWLIAFLVIILESIGAIFLFFGIGTRITAALFTILALGIIFTSHIQNGFFMNWFGNQEGEGYEFFLLWIGMSLALIFSGGGKFSIDRMLNSKG